jgi:hypothetical protein
LRQWRRSKLARARGPHAAEWLKGYERAWRTPGTAALAELFTEDAAYSTAPYENPHRGLAAIGKMWDAERLGRSQGE